MAVTVVPSLTWGKCLDAGSMCSQKHIGITSVLLWAIDPIVTSEVASVVIE